MPSVCENCRGTLEEGDLFCPRCGTKAVSLSVCSDCRHYRIKAVANPFSRPLDAWSPDILEAKNKWEQEQNETALLERQRFEAEQDFDYEPNYYPWCERWTREEGRETIDPVTGKRTPIYVVCARANSDGACPFFEKRARGRS